MDIFTLGKSKTRQKILALFLENPGKTYYLQQLKRQLFVSAGNLRRELLKLTNYGLFERVKQGRLVYYKINLENPIISMIKPSDDDQIRKVVFRWATSVQPFDLPAQWYCGSRDIFQARLDVVTSQLQKAIGDNGYLVSAIVGEIGNNSFDHNLGRWPDVPGIGFIHLVGKRAIVLVDRGQGILKTIRNVLPKTENDAQALKIAFTKVISGRAPENRGNGLKFVGNAIKKNKWALKFSSGQAMVIIDRMGKMTLQENREVNQGCLAVINY